MRKSLAIASGERRRGSGCFLPEDLLSVLVRDVNERDCVAVTGGPDGDVSALDPLGLGLNPAYDCPPYVVTP
jgi:hypothetical protein